MLKILVQPCSSNHKNLVIIDRADANDRDINALKRMAKSFGAYFNRLPQCFICKEPFTADGPILELDSGDPSSIDAAVIAMRDALKGN
jgi:hypothetical protein